MRPRRATPQQVKDELETAVAQGRQANFEAEVWISRHGKERPKVPAEWVRELVLGPTAKSGIQILGATIEGTVDLHNARGPDGGSCNTLKLEDCVLWGSDPANHPALDARHSHLSRLSLINCRTTGIHLSSAVIDGDLILDRLQRHTTGTRECWVRARGIRVGGSVTASGAKLRIKRVLPYWQDRVPENLWSQISPGALDLQRARIDGSLALRHGFEADGGVIIEGAVIGGYMVAEGAQLFATGGDGAHDDALAARNVQIRGSVSLSDGLGERFRAHGTVEFASAQIGGDLNLMGAELAAAPNSIPRGSPGNGHSDQESSLSLTGATVSGDLLVQPGGTAKFEVANGIELSGASIGGSVWIDGARELTAWDATFGSSFELKNCAGSATLTGSRIRTGMTVDGSDAPLYATGLTVGRDLTLNGSMAGPIDLAGTTVGGSVVIDGTAGLPVEKLVATGLRVGADLKLKGWISGTLDLAGAVIAGDLVCGTSRRNSRGDESVRLASLMGSQPVLSFKDARVAGDLTVHGIRTVGRLPNHDLPAAAIESLDSIAAVRKQIPLWTNTSMAKVDLSGLVVGSLDDDHGRSWFEKDVKDPQGHDRRRFLGGRSFRIGRWRLGDTESEWRPNVQLVLEGLDYRRIDVLHACRTEALPCQHASPPREVRDDTTSVARQPRFTLMRRALLGLTGYLWWRRRADPEVGPHLASRRRWLRGQYETYPPNVDEYFPQPYEQLARIWRAAGDFKAADAITHDRLELEHVLLSNRGLSRWATLWQRVWQFLWWFVVQFPFGYGLRAKRAFAAFAFWWLVVGFLPIFVVEDLLKVDASSIATVVSRDGGTERIVVQVEDAPRGLAEVQCGDSVNKLIYPLDVMIPLIDLRQESRCTIASSHEPLWGWLKGFYAIIGWGITSGLILTLSGVVRRQVER